VVVVDMGSDSILPIIKQLGDRLPLVTHIRPGKVLNRSNALNTGIQTAQGSAIAILDDDNLHAPDHLENLVSGLKNTGADLVFTGGAWQTFTANGELLHEVRMSDEFNSARLLFGNYIGTTSTAFLKSIWKKVGGFDQSFPVYEDWDFLIRVSVHGKIAHIGTESAISRSFNGLIGIPEHHKEVKNCARCLVGIFWKHRHLYSGNFFREHHAMWKNQYPHVPRWGVNQSSLPTLISWWWFCRLGIIWKS
jgi:glycosyltransferase involved in cell wall biosynthesis